MQTAAARAARPERLRCTRSRSPAPLPGHISAELARGCRPAVQSGSGSVQASPAAEGGGRQAQPTPTCAARLLACQVSPCRHVTLSGLDGDMLMLAESCRLQAIGKQSEAAGLATALASGVGRGAAAFVCATVVMRSPLSVSCRLTPGPHQLCGCLAIMLGSVSRSPPGVAAVGTATWLALRCAGAPPHWLALRAPSHPHSLPTALLGPVALQGRAAVPPTLGTTLAGAHRAAAGLHTLPSKPSSTPVSHHGGPGAPGGCAGRPARRLRQPGGLHARGAPLPAPDVPGRRADQVGARIGAAGGLEEAARAIAPHIRPPPPPCTGCPLACITR